MIKGDLVSTSEKAPLRLQVQNLSMTFAGQQALSGFALTVGSGEVRGLVGENGSGKSTFIKILSGYHQPDDGGEILIENVPLKFASPASSRELGVRFVHQDLGLIDSLSVLENLNLGSRYRTRIGTIRGRAERLQATEDLARAGLTVDLLRPLGELSPAEKTGVAIARALRPDSTGAEQDGAKIRLLVLDEPTATLPATEVDDLITTVKAVAASGTSVLYVSHRLEEIFALTDNVTVLRDGHVVAERATSTLDHRELIRLLVGSELEDIRAEATALDRASRDDRLVVARLDSAPLADISFTAASGEVVGIAGITGSGRDILLASIFGAIPRDRGSVEIDGVAIAAERPDASIAAGFAMLPADRRALGGIMEWTARENISLPDLPAFWNRFSLSRRREVSEAKSWFSRLSVRPSDGTESTLATFSGGNQQKVLFAKWLRRNPRVFLLDEPTQGVDVGAKAEIHREILRAAETGATVLISSSDADELVALCHRVLVLREGRIVAEVPKDALTTAVLSEKSLGEVVVIK
jgi:ribose transport system ATP-binding protein